MTQPKPTRSKNPKKKPGSLKVVARTPAEIKYKLDLHDKLVALFLKENLTGGLDTCVEKVFGFIEREFPCTAFTLKVCDDNNQIITKSCSNHPRPARGVAGSAARNNEAVIVPIISGAKTLGMIEISRDAFDEFGATRQDMIRNLAGMTGMVVDFILEKQTEKRKIFRKNSQLEVMHDVGELINSITDMSKLLNIIINMVRDVMNVEICTLMMIDEETNKLVLTAQGGLSENIEENFVLFTIWEEIASWIVKHESPILIEDINHDERFAGKLRDECQVKSFISVPLRVKGRIDGILNANKRKDKDVFEKEDLDLFVTFANQVAKAIESAQLYEDLQDVYLSTITSLVSAIEAKDPYTHGHSERVARYSTEIARHFNPPFDKKELEILNYAAILHDIGKIGIKEQILNKIEPLLDEEFLLIRSHPGIGAEIIRPIKFLQSAATIAQHHHERFDGKGYPDGMKGEEIPLGARIICVGDSFDAMTSTRAYRGSLPEEIALKELMDDKGTQFDPAVVEVFLRIYPDLKARGVIRF